MFSCEAPQEEVFDMSDILPSSERDYDAVDTVRVTGSDDSLLQSFNSNGFSFDAAELVSKKLLPSRFGPDSSYTVQLISNADTLFFHYWIYSDSSKVMNAFYNWIDCFGSNCKSFHIGEERNYQMNAMHILVGDKKLIYLEGEELDFNKWYAYCDSIGADNDWSYAIEQRKKGRSRWFRFEEGKKVKYQ